MIDKAILKINPDAEFTINGDDINQINWLNETTPISKADIEAKITELEIEFNSEEWKRNRQAEYP